MKYYKKVQYGPHTRTNWNQLVSLDHYIVREFLDEIRGPIQNAGLQLWAFGGILEPWITEDFDGALTGHSDMSIIKPTLELIISAGFRWGVYADIKYTNTPLFHWSYYAEGGGPINCVYGLPYSHKIINDQWISNGEEYDGLWWRAQKHPLAKTIDKKHHFKDPIQVI